MLEVRQLSVCYGLHRALDDVSLTVDKGEVVVILGANGAGKSTLLATVAGTGEGQAHGEVLIDGVPRLGAPAHDIVAQGVVLVPEGRGVFGELTVRENLLLGAYTEHAREFQQEHLERVLELFPKLHERLGQAVRTMSGGEQQMVAIGRAMLAAPSILMLDEPSLGLSPLLCKELFRSLAEVRKSGLGILLVEQNAKQSLAIADRGYLLDNGRISGASSAAALAADPAVQQAYLGAGSTVVPAATPPAPTPSPAPTTSPAPLRLAARPAARPGSDALIPVSIADLVNRAATLQARHVAEARGDRPRAGRGETPARGVRATDLGTVLGEIERAAARARQPSTGQPTGTAASAPSPAASTLPQTPAAPGPLPPFAAPQRPLLEIYRRQGKRGPLVRVNGE